jgi:hypothetical protein
MNKYIEHSAKKAIKENKEKLLFNKIVVYVQNALPEDFDLNYVLEYIENKIPAHLAHLIDAIYVGEFPFLKERDLNALYEDGAIYTTNEQSNEEDMIDDIVHEMAHSVEQLAGSEIYADRGVEEEFIGKRKRLYHILRTEGHNVPESMTFETDYSKEFDEILYKTIGYDKLVFLTMGLFASPYGATSLREYFANGFENYFIGDRDRLRKTSPKLYNKLEFLTNYEY